MKSSCTGWRVFFSNFVGPHGPHIISCKSMQNHSALVIFSPFFSGSPVLVREFRFPALKYQQTAKGASRKGPRLKSSGMFSTLFVIFRAGQKGKNRQQVSKICYDTFRQFSRGTSFRPLLGGSDLRLFSLGDTRGGFGECTLVPVFVPGEHANVPSFRFSFLRNIRMYPRSGFVPGNICQNHPLPTKPPFCQPPNFSRPFKNPH